MDEALELGNYLPLSYKSPKEQEYIAFLSVIAEEGARFALASDAHDIGRLEDIRAAWRVAEQLRLTPGRIWSPTCRPVKGSVTNPVK